MPVNQAAQYKPKYIDFCYFHLNPLADPRGRGSWITEVVLPKARKLSVDPPGKSFSALSLPLDTFITWKKSANISQRRKNRCRLTTPKTSVSFRSSYAINFVNVPASSRLSPLFIVSQRLMYLSMYRVAKYSYNHRIKRSMVIAKKLCLRNCTCYSRIICFIRNTYLCFEQLHTRLRVAYLLPYRHGWCKSFTQLYAFPDWYALL